MAKIIKETTTWFTRPKRIFLAIAGVICIIFSLFGAKFNEFGQYSLILFLFIPLILATELFYEQAKFYDIVNFFMTLVLAAIALYITVELKLGVDRLLFFNGTFLLIYSLNLFEQQIVDWTEGFILKSMGKSKSKKVREQSIQ